MKSMLKNSPSPSRRLAGSQQPPCKQPCLWQVWEAYDTKMHHLPEGDVTTALPKGTPVRSLAYDKGECTV